MLKCICGCSWHGQTTQQRMSCSVMSFTVQSDNDHTSQVLAFMMQLLLMCCETTHNCPHERSYSGQARRVSWLACSRMTSGWHGRADCCVSYYYLYGSAAGTLLTHDLAHAHTWIEAQDVVEVIGYRPFLTLGLPHRGERMWMHLL